MVMRSISGCLPTKYRPSATRNRLMRSRTSAASFSRSGSDIEAMRSSGSSVKVVSSSLPRGCGALQAGAEVEVDAAAQKVFVLVEPFARLLADGEVVARVAEDERLHE